MRDKFLIYSILAIVSVVTVSGCTSNNMSNMSGNSSSTNLGANAVAIQNFAFNPATLNVQVGTKVTWKNLDSTAHHVVSDTGAFDSGVLNNGQSYSFTFNQAGNYPYHCSIHPSMKGTIVVTTTAPSNPSTSTPSTTGGSGY
jgi:plastocyanin